MQEPQFVEWTTRRFHALSYVGVDRIKRDMDTDMNALPNVNIEIGTTTTKVDDAVGVHLKNWFVAIVNNKAERQCSTKLEKLGYECYVPIQEELHKWKTGAKRIVNRVIFPAMVFIHCTENERRHIVNLAYIKRFMPNRTSAKDKFGKHKVAIIPDVQIQQLKFILGHANAPVDFIDQKLRLGDKVRIVRGGLTGVEGYIIADGNDTFFAVCVDFLGMAKVKVNKMDVEGLSR